MSKSSSIYSLSIAEHAVEGGDVDAHKLPDIAAAGITFQGMATTDAIIDSMAFEELSHTQEGSRSTPGQQALAPIALLNTSGGSRYGVASGDYFRAGYPDEISQSSRFKGAAGAAPGTTPWGKWIGSSMGLHSPANATIQTHEASADGSTFRCDSALPEAVKNDLKVGAPVRLRKAGEFVDEYAVITKVTDDGSDVVCNVFPSFTAAVGAGETIQLCYAYYPVVGRANCANKDFALRFAMGGLGSDASVQTLAVGNRCTGIEITNDGGATILSLSAKPLAVVSEDDDAGKAGVIDAPESAGALFQHRYGARVDLSANTKGASAPVTAARSYLPNFDHTISISFETGEGTPETRSILRGSTHEVHNATCTVTLQTEKNSDFQNMLVKDERRGLILGFGPAGNGQGGACFILNCSRDDGASSVGAGDQSRIQQQTVLRAVEGQQLCDETGLTEAEKRLSSAPFMIILPKV